MAKKKVLSERRVHPGDTPVIRAAKAVVIGFKKPKGTIHDAINEAARLIDLHVDLTGLVAAARNATSHPVERRTGGRLVLECDLERLESAVAKAEGR